ncbi:MAG: GNAT family N-acetyltransferase [Oscillospiraceae bacterium]|nr:GNAT family N-acetyltransferase [Oscillospiraceae bacterium]
MAIINTHNITLTRGSITLRPLCDDHAPLLVKWGSNPDVLYWTDGPDAQPQTLDDVQGIWGQVSQQGLCFLIEYEGTAIGECWLQEMHERQRNINYVDEPTELDLRRIDMSIGEKAYWGRGIGTQLIGMLTQFALEQQNVDVLYGITFDYNKRSQRAFEENGFRFAGEYHENEHTMTKLRLTRQEYFARFNA